MPYDVYYTMLFTEQGMGNLISITDEGATSVLFSALIDFGTARTTRSSLTKETVDFVKSYILNNRTQGKPGRDLDLVAVSHQDEDHWSLFPSLIKSFDAIQPPLTIDRFSYGGNYMNYGPSAKRAVDQLWHLANRPREMPLGQRSAYDSPPLSSLAAYPAAGPKVTFEPVMCNASTPSRDPGIRHNTVSLMVAVQLWENDQVVNSILLPGDLTSCTIWALRALPNTANLRRTGVLSVPHHGSHRTISDNYQSQPAKRTFVLGQWFASHLQAQSLGASAGFTTHRHPYQAVIEMFSKETAVLPDTHGYVAYDMGADRYENFSTDRAIFTNYSGIPPRPDKKKQGTNAAGAPSIQSVAHRIVFRLRRGAIDCSVLDVKSSPTPGRTR